MYEIHDDTEESWVPENGDLFEYRGSGYEPFVGVYLRISEDRVLVLSDGTVWLSDWDFTEGEYCKSRRWVTFR